MNKKCDGWRRYGSAFGFGPPRWVQCTNEAAAELKIVQDNKKCKMYACNPCWEEALNTSRIIIESARPVTDKKEEIKNDRNTVD